MKHRLPNPKKLSNQQLWQIILNVFPKKAPKRIQKWYQDIEKEFYNRDIKLEFICSAK